MALPIKTLIEDIESLATYLNGQVGWVPIEKAKKTIDSKLVDNRKLEAAKRIGLLDRDGANIKLTDDGRTFITGDVAEREAVMQRALRQVQLYVDTVEWMHHSKITNPTKTVIGNYWHDKHQDQLEGAQGAALTDAVIFFMRVAGAAGLGKFTRGTNSSPDSYFKTDAAAIEAFVTAKREDADEETLSDEAIPDAESDMIPATPAGSRKPDGVPPVEVTTSPAVHVNIEIHIAADAKAETVAEIFKNMRKYVLNNPDEPDA